MIDKEKENEPVDNPSRRSFLEAGSAALAAATLVGLTASAQHRDNTREAEGDHSTSDPGPENMPFLTENPNTNTPPPSDHGGIGPISAMSPVHNLPAREDFSTVKVWMDNNVQRNCEESRSATLGTMLKFAEIGAKNAQRL